ncbi:FAD-binding oxidoreductase [Streptomyces sp. NPDC001985]|uniref:FAD-binding oxidoreductase n=1 Tax=Streptomyces sp. NPDC001985 TaxID=3154406 RepID=UPI00332F17BC
MDGLNRRRFITGTGAAIATSAATAAPAAAGPAAAPPAPAPASVSASASAATVTPSDARYADLVSGMNGRFSAAPEEIRLPASTGQVVRIVREAARRGKYLVIRGGGHGFGDFVFNKEAEILLDLRLLNRVGYDERRGAFFVEPGATLLQVYETLYTGWGVTVPGGACHSIGAGGHFAGGGYGMLSRRHGLVCDHIEAAEVVTVDRRGEVRALTVTRDRNDPHRDLLWALAGGGGGNFGVVTRYWLRTRGATGEPSELLPAPPATVHYTQATWPWERITEAGFGNLLREYGKWSRRHDDPGSPYAGMGHLLFLNHITAGNLFLVAQIDAGTPDARRLMEEFVGFLSRAMGAEPDSLDIQHLPFLKATTHSTMGGETLTNPSLRTSHKSAFMSDGFPERQIDALHRHLTREDYSNLFSYVILSSAGARINAPAPDATASPHRDALFAVYYECYWRRPEDDERNIRWVREVYQDMYADTGGVPVPNGVTDGCYVNYADRDLSDPAFNRSASPWHELYYKGNYPRLQRVKARYDPTNFFRHRQSIALPGRE